MKKLMFLALMMAFGLGATAQRIQYAPVYDGLSTYTSGGFTPLVWNNTTHTLEKKDTTSVTTSSETISGVNKTGRYTKNSRTNKVVSFSGIGQNNAGELNLFDSSGNNYLVVKDTTGKWYVNSYRPVSVNIRGVRALNIDTTTNRVTVDSTFVASSGMVIGAATIFRTGTGSPESVVTAPIGSLWLRTDGSTSTTLYIKTSGAGNTGWTAK